jgi:WD40 repeat protein
MSNSPLDFIPPEIRALQDNTESTRRLVEQLRTPLAVVPFVGAGLSVPHGMPGWTAFLTSLAQRAGRTQKIRMMLRAGEYEEAALELERTLTPFSFNAAIERDFGDHKLVDRELRGAVVHVNRLSAGGPIVTTNFDRVLETVAERSGLPFATVVAGAKPDSIGRMMRQHQRGLVKLHGDWGERAERVLTKPEYDRHYGSAGIDLTKPLPALLQAILLGKSLLFLGCSLNQDRTVLALGQVAQISPEMVHFAVLEVPKAAAARREKEAFLGEHNILPIWYPNARHDLVEPFLAYLAEQQVPTATASSQIENPPLLTAGIKTDAPALSRTGSSGGQSPPDLKAPGGFRLRHLLRGHTGSVQQLSWSAEGRKIATAGDTTIRAWNADSGRVLWSASHTDTVLCVAWSPNGRTVASAALDKTIRLWDAASGRAIRTFPGGFQTVWNLTWSPNGETLAAGTDASIRLYDARTGRMERTLAEAFGPATNVAWSPDGSLLAATTLSQGIRLLDNATGEQRRHLVGHAGFISCLAWAPDGQMVAAGSDNSVVQLWDMESGWQVGVLEGLTGPVSAVCFSHDGQFIAAYSDAGELCVWHCETLERVGTRDTGEFGEWARALAFHPKSLTLAAGGEGHSVMLWDLDRRVLLGTAASAGGVFYTNAKAVLLGDTGVGKSGLSLVLSRQPFAATESTHARHVLLFDRRTVRLDDHRTATREVLLWDMAGQPGYRLVHQLHLNEVAVALVVFDARSETDPFAGVWHWDRALRQAQRVQGDSAPLKKFLVAARVDRGGPGVSKDRVDALVRELGFDAYFETSAKDGWQIPELSEAILKAVEWPAQPQVSSTELFQQIKEFLVVQKRKGRLLSPVDDLYRAFLDTVTGKAQPPNLRAQFETCIGRVESRGLIRRLSFGGLVLLQPELLDVYASALINAAKDEPDGLGSISEDAARQGRFQLSDNERIRERAQESLLLIATVEDLLSHEIALREPAEDGPHLVFPSQLTRENPDLPDPQGKSTVLDFEGAVLNIYATLAVRLAHSGMFAKKDMWKNAATYTANVGGTCGIYLRLVDDGRGELMLFFDEQASGETRFQFEEFVWAHLVRRALPDRLARRPLYVCPTCRFVVPEQLLKIRVERGVDWINCPGCDSERINLSPGLRPSHSEEQQETVFQMDRTADAQRRREAVESIIQGKVAVGDFDVFLAYTATERLLIEQLAEQLRLRGINPWLDRNQSPPSRWMSDIVAKVIPNVRIVAICMGPKVVPRWQVQDIQAFTEECITRGIRVLVVFFPGMETLPPHLEFLSQFYTVSFDEKNDAQVVLDNLESVIAGRRHRVLDPLL